MFSLIFSQSLFWFLNHLTFSALSGGCVYYITILKEKYDALSKVQAESKSEFVQLISAVAVHLSFQFLFHFVYTFSIFDSASKFVFLFFLIFINRIYFKKIHNISDDHKSTILMCSDFFTVFLIFICFLSVLGSQSSNSCGQALFFVWMFCYVVVGMVSMTNCYINIRNTDNELAKLLKIQPHDELSGTQNINKQIGFLNDNKIMHFEFSIAVLLSCFFYQILLFFKLGTINLKKNKCNNLFENRNFFFMLFFSVLEFGSMNALNGFVFYRYYFKNRKNFNTTVNFEEKFIEEILLDRRSTKILQN